jgi:TonB family protein
MAPLISYLLKMVLCSGVLYAYYHVALRNNRFHQWNRYYLLLATLLPITLPLLQLPVPFTGSAAPGISTYYTNYTTRIITLREFILTAPSAPALSYIQVLWLGYGLVALLLLSRVGYGCWKIWRLIRTSTVREVRPYRFIQSEQVQAPFSFFRYIFWTRDMSPDSSDGQQILQHELAHVKEQHSIDKLIMELVCAICWINPFFHLFKRELALVHEFIADREAATGRVADYARTILQVSLQSRQLSFTNNFFHPPIKRRINMLLHQKSNFTIMKKFITIPVIIGLIIFIGCKQQDGDAPLEPKPDIIDIGAAELNAIQPTNIQLVSINGDTTFVKTKDGKTYRSIGKRNRPYIPKEWPKSSDNEIFTFVEEPPTFPGGEEALAKYLSKNIRYPKEAVDRNVAGTIFVQFIIGADGSILDAVTVGQIKGSGLEEESLRVVRDMPKWNAGKQNGRQVAVQFNLPIRFVLQDDKLSMLKPFLLFKQSRKC